MTKRLKKENPDTHTELSKSNKDNGMSESFQRIIVYVRRELNAMFVEADFSTCLMDYFNVDGDVTHVAWTLKDNKIMVQPANLKGSKESSFFISRLQHPAFCAMRRLHTRDISQIPQEIVSRGMDVGVSVLLESQEGHVLITRRAKHMRTFPQVWVPPGGHLDAGETILVAALREVKEETSLELHPDDVSYRILGLFESVFPPVLYAGNPRRHHFVIYMHIKNTETSQQLQKKIKLDPMETDAYLWLNKTLMDIIVTGNEVTKEHVDIVECNAQGEQVPGKMSMKALMKKMPLPGEDIERLSTGTRYALKLLSNSDNMDV